MIIVRDKFAGFAAMVLFVAMSSGMAKADNLVNNAGFEDPTNKFNGWVTQSFSGESFTGWANTGTGSAVTGCVGHDACIDAINGAYIGQTINTVAGQTYTLSFWVGEDWGPTSEMAIYWNGTLVADVLNPSNAATIGIVGPWRQYIYSGLVATGGLTYFQVNGRDDPSMIAFDDFDVHAEVPEPASLFLLGTGLVGAAGALRRKIS